MLEYPKHLHIPGGNPMKDFIVVNSAEEELEALKRIEAQTKPVPERAPVEPATEPTAPDEDTERAALLTQAATLGVKIDKRWGVERLREAVAGAAQ